MKRHRPDAGFSLAALIFFATAASILAAAAVPAYQMQAKREREKELIFRGEEYTRAIQKYQRKFGVYPGSVDQLVQTNGLRFLRRPYKDPITEKDFRFIRINPDGSVSGSKLFVQNANPQSLFGNTQTFGQPPGAQQQQQQQQQQQRGQQPQPSVQQPQVQPSPQAGQRQGQPGVSTPFAPIGNAAGTPIAAGGIIGVGSDSDEASVMVYNQRQKYSEWEFIAILGQAGPQPQRGQQPAQVLPGQTPPPGGQRQTTPFPGPIPSSPSSSPFGPQPGATPFGPTAPFAPTTPFGPGSGPQQGPQPFGSGNPPALPGQPAPGKLP